MSNIPVQTPEQIQTGIVTDSADVRKSTVVDDGSISENDDLSILLKSDDRNNSISSHVDENNENDAV